MSRHSQKMSSLLGDVKPGSSHVQIINRPTACSPDAAPPQQHFVPRWQRASGKASVPGVGAVAVKVTAPAQTRTFEGPLCVRMTYSISNVRPSCFG